MELDPRIVRIGIEVNGRLKTYEGLTMTATGTKFGNANQNECEITLTNLDKPTRDYILTETSPFNLNRTPKRVVVEAGRVSYGAARVYVGDIISTTSSNPLKPKKEHAATDKPTGSASKTTSPTSSQPPDITITLKCLSGNFQKGNIVARNQTGLAPLSQIAQGIADDLGLALAFQAEDRQIANYTYTGGALKQVEKLGELGNINAYIDDEILVVKNNNAPLRNQVKIVNAETGMIGIPELTERGIRVKFLLDNQTILGGALQLTSRVYPAANGLYTIYKLSFEIASRDVPFYWIAEAKRA